MIFTLFFPYLLISSNSLKLKSNDFMFFILSLHGSQDMAMAEFIIIV
jgi:hypothetical protein